MGRGEGYKMLYVLEFSSHSISPSNPLSMDSTQSQLGPRYTETQMYGDYHYEEHSSDPHFDDRSDDPAVFVDLLANNFHLDVDLRSDLHSFLDVSRILLFLQFYGI